MKWSLRANVATTLRVVDSGRRRGKPWVKVVDEEGRETVLFKGDTLTLNLSTKAEKQ